MTTLTFVLCVLGILVQCAFIAVEHKQDYVKALILKTSASLIFVYIGYRSSLLCSDSMVAKYVLIGLGFGAAGDFLLNLRFVLDKIGSKVFLVGILVFLTGHIMYLIALIKLSNSVLLSLIVGVIISALLLVWIFSKIEAKMAFKIFGVFYIGAVTIMACFACINAINSFTNFSLVYAIGAILFLVSDVVLILNTFTKTTKFSLRITNLLLYYVGQLMIACSLLLK